MEPVGRFLSAFRAAAAADAAAANSPPPPPPPAAETLAPPPPPPPSGAAASSSSSGAEVDEAVAPISGAPHAFPLPCASVPLRRPRAEPLPLSHAVQARPQRALTSQRQQRVEGVLLHLRQQQGATAVAQQQDRRVYVGNLAYDVKWGHLKDFMRQAGDVIFADVLLLGNGMSKVSGIMAGHLAFLAQTAITTLSNQNLMGRLVYVREDREVEPRFNAAGPPARGGFDGGYGTRGGFAGGYGGPMGGGMGMQGRGGGGNQIF
ncbi:hypothetical protein B0A55_08902, partial [Friedmanniomyces simplex]